MNTNQTLKVGIAGYGVVGKRRKHFIDQHPRMKTVSVCDQNFNESGSLERDIVCHHDYRELLREDLDVLFVSLPNYLAPAVTIAALKRGLHVFCEKPPGRSVADVEDVLRVHSERSDLKLKYGFNHRYHESVREAMRIVASGELGQVLNVRGVYGKSAIVPFEGEWRAQRELAGGGILLDQGIHMVDLIRLFCDDFVEVKSFVSNEFWGFDVEDNAFAIMRDARGRVAMLHSSATQWQHRFGLDIALADGYIELQGILTGSKSYGEETLIVGKRGESTAGALHYERTKYLEDNSWRDEIDEFADAILRNGNILQGGPEQALETMKLVEKIYDADPAWKADHPDH